MSKETTQRAWWTSKRKPIAPQTNLPKKKAKYTGNSTRNLQRRTRVAKDLKLKQILSKTAPIQTYFKKQNSEQQPMRKCKSKYSSKNDVVRAIKHKTEDANKRSGPSHSTKGHKQYANGVVRKRTRKLSRSSRKAVKAKAKRAESKLSKKPKLSYLVSTVRERLESLRKRIRSCTRCSVCNLARCPRAPVSVTSD